MLSNMENLVIFGSLIYNEGQNSLLQNLSFGKGNVILYIVDERLERGYASSIIDNDPGMRLEAQTLSALRRRENVVLVAKHASEFQLPDSAKELDTIYVYYRDGNSTGLNSEFDVMCMFNDFPRTNSNRRYVLTDRSDTTDYSSVEIQNIKRPFDVFSRGGELRFDELDYSAELITQLTRALIEWLKSGFDRESSTDAFHASVNVYNRMTVSGETSELRPNWVLNVETPAIKGLIYSTGLDYRDLTVENATSFTDGIKTQSLMLHSAEYRRELTFQAIELLRKFMETNDMQVEDFTVEFLQDFLEKFSTRA